MRVIIYVRAYVSVCGILTLRHSRSNLCVTLICWEYAVMIYLVCGNFNVCYWHQQLCVSCLRAAPGVRTLLL